MDWSLLVATAATFITLVSILVTVHYKKLGERDATIKTDVLSAVKLVKDDVKDLDRGVKHLADTVNKMQQELRGVRSDLDNVEKDTRRLEHSLEKDVKQVSQKVDEIYKMIFTLVQNRRTTDV